MSTQFTIYQWEWSIRNTCAYNSIQYNSSSNYRLQSNQKLKSPSLLNSLNSNWTLQPLCRYYLLQGCCITLHNFLLGVPNNLDSKPMTNPEKHCKPGIKMKSVPGLLVWMRKNEILIQKGQMHAACTATGKWLHPQHTLRAIEACSLALNTDGATFF